MSFYRDAFGRVRPITPRKLVRYQNLSLGGRGGGVKSAKTFVDAVQSVEDRAVSSRNSISIQKISLPHGSGTGIIVREIIKQGTPNVHGSKGTPEVTKTIGFVDKRTAIRISARRQTPWK